MGVYRMASPPQTKKALTPRLTENPSHSYLCSQAGERGWTGQDCYTLLPFVAPKQRFLV